MAKPYEFKKVIEVDEAQFNNDVKALVIQDWEMVSVLIHNGKLVAVMARKAKIGGPPDVK